MFRSCFCYMCLIRQIFDMHSLKTGSRWNTNLNTNTHSQMEYQSENIMFWVFISLKTFFFPIKAWKLCLCSWKYTVVVSGEMEMEWREDNLHILCLFPHLFSWAPLVSPFPLSDTPLLSQCLTLSLSHIFFSTFFLVYLSSILFQAIYFLWTSFNNLMLFPSLI